MNFIVSSSSLNLGQSLVNLGTLNNQLSGNLRLSTLLLKEYAALGTKIVIVLLSS